MSTDIQTLSVDMKNFVNMMPTDLVPCNKAFMKTECDYAWYDDNYTWEDIENILNDVLPWGVSFVIICLKSLKKWGMGYICSILMLILILNLLSNA